MNEVEKKIIDELDNKANNNDSELINVIFNMPDKQFELIAPLLLESIESELNDPINQTLFINNFKKTDGNLENINEEVEEMTEAIDKEFNEISPLKRDFIKQILYYCVNSLNQANEIAKQSIQVPCQLCNENAKLPIYAHATDSGADLFATEDITIEPGETKLINTGLKFAIPQGYEIQVRPKSGRCLKTKLRIANTPGTIDAGYRDEVGVIIDNIEPPIKDVLVYKDEKGNITNVRVIPGDSYTIKSGEKFAQLVIMSVPHASFNQIDNVLEIAGNRGGGFGSTGLK